MTPRKDKAICLRKADYSETSQVVTLFTRSAGKLSAIAKGSKRKKSSFDGPIEIFSYGDIVYTHPEKVRLATLTEFQQMPTFQYLSSKLISLHCGMFAAELVDVFTEEHDPHPELFDSLIQFLDDVQAAENSNQSITLLIIFQLTLLNEVGAKPLLGRCANCKARHPDKWPSIYFSSVANGIVCPDCEVSFADKRRISRVSAEVLSNLQNIPKANKNTIFEIESLLVNHFTEIMHRRPRMAKYFVRF